VTGLVKNLDIYFFSANWCPHCPKAIKNFNEFLLSYNDQIINGYKINCILIDCSDHDNQMATDLINVYPPDDEREKSRSDFSLHHWR
jgi:thiol-disulfide isomerase/thioredoxin